jgi:elongation factor Ts
MSFDTKALVRLRQLTGAGVVDCQDALEQSQGDIEGAIEILRKRGTLKAAKKAERETREGVIDVALASDQSAGIIVQIHCETDFVAKNDSFIEFVQTIARTALSKNQGTQALFDANKESVILKTGENIVFGRAEKLTGGYLASYLHPNRKVGVLVQFEKTVAAELARDIAMHIAASNPSFLTPEEIPAEVVEKEKEIYLTQLKAEKKPVAIAEKIVIGKLQKYYEENCLLLQPFIKDEGLKVEKLLAQAGQAKILKFIRYQLA